MVINSELLGTTVLIKISGKLNIEKVADFESEIDKFLNDRVKTIILDLSKIDYIDSSALGSLIKAVNSAKNIDIEILLINLPKSIKRIFELAYLDKFFSIRTFDEITKEFPHINFN